MSEIVESEEFEIAARFELKDVDLTFAAVEDGSLSSIQVAALRCSEGRTEMFGGDDPDVVTFEYRFAFIAGESSGRISSTQYLTIIRGTLPNSLGLVIRGIAWAFIERSKGVIEAHFAEPPTIDVIVTDTKPARVDRTLRSVI